LQKRKGQSNGTGNLRSLQGRQHSIPDDEAKKAVEAINRVIDQRYALHARELATRGDVELARKEIAQVEVKIAQLETSLVKWIVGTGMVVAGLVVALLRF
jgi:hypothetical protein